jgi:hypothetical protein
MNPTALQIPRGDVLFDVLSNSFAMNLTLVGDLLWVITYILIIRCAVRDRAPGIPVAAVCLNFSWEIVFTVFYPPEVGGQIDIRHLVVQLAWIVFDVVLVAQAIRFGRSSQNVPLVRQHYRLLVWAAVAMAFGGELVYASYTQDLNGVVSALLINLVMSVLFIHMLFTRASLRGISFAAAWTKMLGSGLVGLSILLIYRTNLAQVSLPLYLFACIAVFDVIYVCLVQRARRQARV